MISENSIWQIPLRDLKGLDWKLDDYRGNVILICNTASKCGFTPQYGDLQKLHEEFVDKGLSVFAFPCNQFGQQEPLEGVAIQNFCELNYGVSFRVNQKVEVNGEHEHPIFTWLKNEAPGILGNSAIKWNFTKFLVDRSGLSIKRYAPMTNPTSLRKDITKLL